MVVLQSRLFARLELGAKGCSSHHPPCSKKQGDRDGEEIWGCSRWWRGAMRNPPPKEKSLIEFAVWVQRWERGFHLFASSFASKGEAPPCRCTPRCCGSHLPWAAECRGCTGVACLEEGRTGELFPPSLIINSLAAKPGFGKKRSLQAKRGLAAGDTNLESDACRGDGPAGFVIDTTGVCVVIPPLVLRPGKSEHCYAPAAACPRFKC